MSDINFNDTTNLASVASTAVTTVSVATANGFAGSSSGTTTPSLTLTTTITGVLSGNGTAISAASTTGSGSVVLATSPTLVTPAIGAATGTSLSVSGQLTSTVATGTAPLVVSSTTQVANLNAATAGSATTATTATNATNVATTQVSTNASFFPLFVSSSTNGNQAADLGTGLTFNPSTNSLTTTTFVGALTGSASGSAASFTGSLAGDITGTQGATVVSKIAGTTVSSTTGSTNVVFSASPTMTGTLAGASSTWSGTLISTGNLTVGSGTNTTTKASLGLTTNGINAGSQIQLTPSNTQVNWEIACNTRSNGRFDITPSGAGNSTFTSPALEIDSTGAVTLTNLAGTGSRAVLADANGLLSAPVSDSRLKKNVVKLSEQLDPISAVKSLEGLFFHWDTSKDRVRYHGEQQEIGMMAQDVEKVVPQAVTMDKNGWKSLDYSHLVPLLIEAVKKQQERIEALEKLL